MAKNIPTFLLNATSQAARNGEYTGSPFTDDVGGGTFADPYLGGNAAGSCACGIGINTGSHDPKLDDWSVLDQNGDSRSPQQSQHIGGDGLGDGDATYTDILAMQGYGTDINDTLNYSAADQEAVADAIYDTATGAINKTGVTVESGDILWGLIPAA